PGVADARVAARVAETGGARSNGEAALIQRKHRDLEAFAFTTQQILLRHLDAVHREVAGIACEDAPLFLDRTARKTLERSLHDERADAGGIPLLLLLQIRPREHQEVVRDIRQRDPALLAAHEVPVTLLDGRRLNRARVAARARLGEPVAGNLAALGLGHEVALLLVLRAPGQ